MEGTNALNGMRNYTDGDEWMVAEDIPNIDFFFCQVWLRSFVNGLRRSCGRNYSKVLGVFKGTDMSFYYGKRDCHEMTRHLVGKLEANPAFGDKINQHIIHHADLLERSAREIPSDLAARSNEELWRIIDQHVKAHTALYEWAWLPNATDMFYPEFTELLKGYLRTKLGSEEEVNTCFVALTAASEKSPEAVQHEEFLRIAIVVENDPYHRELFLHADGPSHIERELREPVRYLLGKYQESYAPISALWVGRPAPATRVIAELSEYLRSEKSPAEQLERFDGEMKAKLLEKQLLVEKLDIDERHQHLFSVFSRFMVTKLHRRYAQLRANYRLRTVFEEIGRRFGIPPGQAKFMLHPEYRTLLVNGAFDVSVLAERERFCVLYAEEGNDRVLTGAEAKRMAEKAVPKVDSNVSELKGQCASLGKATGRVKIILTPADLPKMDRGDILVAIATNPDVVPAMKKAGAIVTEQGGVTSHAAIVSRELGVPCVIGTKVATRALRDGDLVEVDASLGVVKILERAK